MTLWQILRDSASRYADRVAVTASGRDFTYAEFDALIEHVATGLRFQGLAPGDRVITVLNNSLQHLCTLFACFRAELICVPMIPTTIPAQVRYAIRQSGARGIVAPTSTLKTVFEDNDELRPDVIITVKDPNPPRWMIPWEVIEAGPGDTPPLPATNVDHLALIIFTSGTTSRPKAVVHSQNRMARRAATLAAELGLTSNDVAFITTGLNRPIALLGQIMTTFLAGGRIVLLESPSPTAFWAGFNAGPPKTFMLTCPSALVNALDAPAAASADFSRLHLWLAGGDAVPISVHHRFRALTGKPLFEMFGMTEAGFYALNRVPHPDWAGCIGQPMRGVETRIIDGDGLDVPTGETGELLLRSQDLMIGYWNDTAETFRILPDGWMRTGDLARADSDGRMWFAGRCKDQINRGGPKVAPLMVEAALIAHPAIEQAVVVGAPAEVGQVPFAFLILRNGAVRPSDGELSDWLAHRLDHLSIPVGFAVLDSFPLTYQGKLDRAQLRLIAANGGITI